jgi:hypothetical protein
MSDSQRFLLDLAVIVFAMWLGAALVFTFGNSEEHRKRDRKEQQSAENEGEHSSNHQANRTIKYAAKIGYESDDHEYESEHHSLPIRQLNVAIGLNIITLLAAVAGLFGLYILYGTLNATRIQANTAQRELELSERPWISAKIEVRKQLSFDAKRKGIMTIATNLINSGHPVALNVEFRNAIVPLGASAAISNQIQQFCEPLRKRPHQIFTNVVFPGDASPVAEVVAFSPEDVAKALDLMHRLDPKMDEITALVISCIDYQFSFTVEHHQTQYGFLLARPVGDGIWRGFSPMGTPSGLQLIQTDIFAD